MSRYRKPSKRPAAGKTILCLSALVLAAAIGGAHAAAAETEPTEGREQIIHKEALYAAECIVEEAEKITGVIAEAAADPYRDRPDIDPDDWMYILANPWNEIGDYTPELASLEGQQFDERIVDDMEAFAGAARAEGLSVFLSSGYRSYDTQMYLFRRKAEEYGEEVAQITDRYYEMKGESLEDTELYQWMSAHCQEYGFIVRFPKGKEDVTGIIYEPWHFRYVGIEAATYIMENDLTLEEFLELYK